MASFLHRALRFNATVTWLSAGDSYSSGVGTDPHAEGSCRRSPSAAGPVAAELLGRQGWTVAHTHTACEGGFVEDMFNQRSQTPGQMSMWEEHVEALGGPRRVDVVALSLGGNDVGFEDVVLACVPFARITELVLGCPSEGELRARIDSEVCGRGSDFIHGITHVGLNPLTGWHRSFHLNNAGHAAVARLLAGKVESTFRAPTGLPQM